MRDLIVEEVSVGATPERAAAARALLSMPGNIVQALIDLGFAPRDVLQACCAVTGVPPAPLGWLRDPKLPPMSPTVATACRKLGAVPLATQNGKLCIGYLDPEVATRSEELGLPKHAPYLALPSDLQKAFALLPPKNADNVATRVNPAPRAEKHATVAMPSVRVPSDEDEALFDDEGHTSERPPSKPASPTREGFAPPLTAPDDGATIVTPPVHLDENEDGTANPKVPSIAEGFEERTTSVAAPSPPPNIPSIPKPARRHPAGAVSQPALSSEAAKNPERLPQAASHVPMMSTQPPATSRTPARSSAPVSPSAATAKTLVAAGPRKGDLGEGEQEKAPKPKLATSSPSSSSSTPGSAPRAPAASGGAASSPPTAASRIVNTDENDAALETHVQARAVLSDGDLDDDSAQIAAPGHANPEPAGEQTGSDLGAFASAGSADQEAVQSQKQRLRRIAQIASIKRYKIDRILGRGGMATVYYATDTKTGQPCALKLMEPHLADDAVFVERFKREIRASISLDHDNIVRVFDYGEEGGTYYMASEYVDGGTVASLLKSIERPLALAAVVPMMSQFLDGLQHAHAQGLTHRDLKPANLMLTRRGEIKIGDFGIAKAQADTTLTKTGALFGTPAYMSPEQAQGQDLDTRSDLFGVGIIFYELLAGYNPFAHENPSTTMFAIAKGVARPIFDANPTVPTIIERIVHKLLARDRAKRYQTAGEARDDLRPLLELLQQKNPGAVARVLASPDAALDELQQAQAVLETERAAKLLLRNPPEHAEAAFRFYKATLLDPNNYDAVNGLTQLRADYGFRFTRADDKQIIELEQSLEKKADQPAVLRRLAEISATHRNLVDMAGFMKRYLRYMPMDTHVQHKLERIIGPDPLAPWTPLPVQVPSETGAHSVNDEMMVAGEEEVASQRAAVKSTPAEPLPPSTAVASPELPEREPRDSFEAIVFAIRGIVEDTVRSLTGDQGIEAVKENLKERFSADGRGEIKEVVKGALGKGKEVVAESLLKEEGRKQIKDGATGLVRRHGRLAAAVFVFIFVMGALTRACAAACSDDVAPAPPPQQLLEMRGQVIDDDTGGDEAAKKSDKAGAAGKTTAAVAAKVATTEQLDAAQQAELEARLLAGKPKETAVVQDTLAARQEDLKRRAKAEGDINRAIDLYTQAIDVDPYAAGARDATLERARLHMANGNRDAAEDDLFRLKRRQDIEAIKGEIETMLEDIKKGRKAEAPPE